MAGGFRGTLGGHCGPSSVLSGRPDGRRSRPARRGLSRFRVRLGLVRVWRVRPSLLGMNFWDSRSDGLSCGGARRPSPSAGHPSVVTCGRFPMPPVDDYIAPLGHALLPLPTTPAVRRLSHRRAACRTAARVRRPSVPWSLQAQSLAPRSLRLPLLRWPDYSASGSFAPLHCCGRMSSP